MSTPNYILEMRKLMQQPFDSGKVVALTNYDEKQVPEYSLPPVLTEDCTTAAQWVQKRRPEILQMYRDEMYGAVPPRPDSVSCELLSCRDDALDNTAVRKEIRIHFAMANGKKHSMVMLLYIPKNAPGPVPVFLGLNFKGNQATTDERDVLQTGLASGDPAYASEEQRGCQVGRWDFRETIRQGFASATICYHDIFPDRADGWGESVLNLFEDLQGYQGSHPRYTAIGAWAWGLSRGLDCLEAEPLVNAGLAAVHGHSRLGKTALWAGANDSRFRMVVSCCSGCGGSALAKRMFGETYYCMGNVFPHWLISSFSRYFMHEEEMTFDQHFLLSLMAPRPLVVNSASEDRWADPKGEFLSALHAGEVYRLFGSEGLPQTQYPEENEYITGDVSYHVHTGPHDQTPLDWEHYRQVMRAKVVRG